jgi:hypothetical protein
MGRGEVLMGKPEVKRPPGRPGFKRKMILKWIFTEVGWGRGMGTLTGLIWLVILTGGRLL